MGPTGRTGPGLPADGLRRPRGPGRFESDFEYSTFIPIKRKNVEQRELFEIIKDRLPRICVSCVTRIRMYFHESKKVPFRRINHAVPPRHCAPHHHEVEKMGKVKEKWGKFDAFFFPSSLFEMRKRKKMGKSRKNWVKLHLIALYWHLMITLIVIKCQLSVIKYN